VGREHIEQVDESDVIAEGEEAGAGRVSVLAQVLRGNGLTLLLLAPGPLMVMGPFGIRPSGFLALAGFTAVAISFAMPARR
jgi:small-conductance mechanosensitive channel